MSNVTIRAANADDLPAIVDLYNHYVLHTANTFDIEPFSIETRAPWFQQFADRGRHQLFVAFQNAMLIGYASSLPFRPKAAYITSVETSVYVHPDAVRQGIGSQLYQQLFADLSGEDVHRAYAGITLPNPASISLHERFGFYTFGVQREVGRKFDRYWDVQWLEKNLPV